MVKKHTKECPHHAEELEYLLALAEKANSILEVGSRYGEALVMMAHRMKKKGRVVSVDLPGIYPWGCEGSENYLRNRIGNLNSEGYDAHLFLGDSKDQKIVEEVRKLGPFDLIFIDGDHRYAGVKADWENYGPMGRVIVFHDLLQHADSAKHAPEIWMLWKEIEGNKSQFVGNNSNMGLGVVCR